jgi:hypothetical protein
VGFVVDIAGGAGFFSTFFSSLLSVFHCGSPYSYIVWVINSMPVGGCSLETWAHPIDMNSINKCHNSTFID